MSTFLELKTRIASDLERELTDETFTGRTWDTEIGAAINDAIRLYRAKRYWFLQGPITAALTSTTTASNSYVAEYAGLVDLKSLRITIDNQKQELTEISFSEMESRHDGSTSEGEPYEYCRFGGRVRLYPTPGSVYTLTWSGTFLEATLTADGDTNAWLDEGEILIKAHAKLIMQRDYIKSYTDIPAAKDAVSEAVAALDLEHSARMGNRKLAARC